MNDQVTIDSRCYAIAGMVIAGDIPKAVGEVYNAIPEHDRRYVFHGILLLLVANDVDHVTISEFMSMTQAVAYECRIKMFHIQSQWLKDLLRMPSGGNNHVHS